MALAYFVAFVQSYKILFEKINYLTEKNLTKNYHIQYLVKGVLVYSKTRSEFIATHRVSNVLEEVCSVIRVLEVVPLRCLQPLSSFDSLNSAELINSRKQHIDKRVY